MTLPELRQKLQHLESQKINLDNEILQTKREIEKLSSFSKEQKIEPKLCNRKCKDNKILRNSLIKIISF